MIARDIVTLLKARVHSGEERLDGIIRAACGSDLMSDVMAFVKEETVLLTGLTTIQVVRTAIIMDICYIVLVRGKKPGTDMVELARENAIALLSTDLPMFLACGRLYEAGLRGGSS